MNETLFIVLLPVTVTPPPTISVPEIPPSVPPESATFALSVAMPETIWPEPTLTVLVTPRLPEPHSTRLPEPLSVSVLTDCEPVTVAHVSVVERLNTAWSGLVG